MTSLRTLGSSAALALMLAIAAHAAAAQDERATAAARELFQEGMRLVDAGQWAPAREQFERAIALRRSPAIAFNLATACVHLGRLVEASELFEEVLRDEHAAPEARTASARQLELLGPRLGHLVVHLVGDAAGVTVRLDGRELPSGGLDVSAPADPGLHAADAQRGGTSIARSAVDVPVGGTAELTLDLVAPAAAPPPTETAPLDLGVHASGAMVHTRADGNTWMWVGIGVGVGVLVILVVAVAVVVLQTTSAGWNGDTSPGTLRW